VGPKRIAGGLLAISVGATVLAALAAFGVVRLRAKLRRKRKARH
jgi:D-alanyl-D-alanine carboxypeptidase (penicillin-binding protein 5/6)